MLLEDSDLELRFSKRSGANVAILSASSTRLGNDLKLAVAAITDQGELTNERMEKINANLSKARLMVYIEDSTENEAVGVIALTNEVKRLNGVCESMEVQHDHDLAEIVRLSQTLEKERGDRQMLTPKIGKSPRTETLDVSTIRAVRRQEREFNALLADLKKIAPWQQRVLYYLSRRESLSFGRKALANNLGISAETLRHNPKFLTDRKLISLDGRGATALYKSTLRKQLQQEFNFIDQDELFDSIMKNIESE